MSFHRAGLAVCRATCSLANTLRTPTWSRRSRGLRCWAQPTPPSLSPEASFAQPLRRSFWLPGSAAHRCGSRRSPARRSLVAIFPTQPPFPTRPALCSLWGRRAAALQIARTSLRFYRRRDSSLQGESLILLSKRWPRPQTCQTRQPQRACLPRSPRRLSATLRRNTQPCPELAHWVRAPTRRSKTQQLPRSRSSSGINSG